MACTYPQGVVFEGQLDRSKYTTDMQKIIYHCRMRGSCILGAVTLAGAASLEKWLSGLTLDLTTTAVAWGWETLLDSCFLQGMNEQ